MRKSLFFKMDGLRHFWGCIIGIVEIREVILFLLNNLLSQKLKKHFKKLKIREDVFLFREGVITKLILHPACSLH